MNQGLLVWKSHYSISNCQDELNFCVAPLQKLAVKISCAFKLNVLICYIKELIWQRAVITRFETSAVSTEIKILVRIPFDCRGGNGLLIVTMCLRHAWYIVHSVTPLRPNTSTGPHIKIQSEDIGVNCEVFLVAPTYVPIALAAGIGFVIDNKARNTTTAVN
jgi:hypothetical protein